MEQLITIIILVSLNAGPVQSDCNLGNCRTSNCSTWRCTLCKDGHYLIKESLRDFCPLCPSSCSVCNGYENCSECITGRYGFLCGSYCAAECENNVCNRQSGICTNGCVDGYYQTPQGTCEQCPLRCTTCSSSDLCFKCKVYLYWGQKCQFTCDRCLVCSLSRGCSSCWAGYNRIYNNVKEGYECTQCPETCASCNHRNECQLCKSGFWGSTCQNICPDSCEICSSNVTCSSCKAGWFGEGCNSDCNVTNCVSCSTDDPNICNECSDGFFSETNSSCISCPTNCLVGTICDKGNGSCTGGCEENWSGEQCDLPCPIKCRKCDQFNTRSCSLCKEGFYGENCEHACSLGCATGQQSQTCDKISGECNFDCRNTLWGTTCDKHCGAGCSGTVCNRTTGHCLSPCHDTHFGQMCDSQCSENCNTANRRSCNETDGYCLNGCRVGWFGGRCNAKCGQGCKENVCDRDDGSCVLGCVAGFKGPACKQDIQLEESTGAPYTAAIGGGVGAAVAVLVIAGLIVVIVVQRRRLIKAKENREHASHLVAAYNQATDKMSLKPVSDYENVCTITATPADQDAPNSVARASTYQKLQLPREPSPVLGRGGDTTCYSWFEYNFG